MHCLPCGGKDVIANILNQDKCPTVPLRLFKFKPARYIVWHVFLVALNFRFHVQRKWQTACLDLTMWCNAYLLHALLVTGMCQIHMCLFHVVKLVSNKVTEPLLSIVQIWWIIGSMSFSSFIQEFLTQDQTIYDKWTYHYDLIFWVMYWLAEIDSKRQ